MEQKVKEDNQQQNILKKSWKRHFYGWNLLTNWLSILLPSGLIIGILQDVIRGLLIMLGVSFGLIYLVGPLREIYLKKSGEVIKKTIKFKPESKIINLILNIVFIFSFNIISIVIIIFILINIFKIILAI